MNSASFAPDRVEMIALRGLPLIEQGDNLADLIAAALESNHVDLADDDVLVVAQKIVSPVCRFLSI